MKKYLLALSCILVCCSFRYSGEIDYWKALKGIKNIKYQKEKNTYQGNLSCYSGCGFCYHHTDYNESKETVMAILRRKRWQFPKTARVLDLKKIHLTGWLHPLLIRNSILTKEPVYTEGEVQFPALDEKVALVGDFYKWSGKKIHIVGTLRLNKKNAYQDCYILENIEKIELVE